MVRLSQCALVSVLCVISLPLMVGVCAAQKYVPPPPPLQVDPCAVKANPNIPVAVDTKAKPVVCPPPGTLAPATTPAPSSSNPGGEKPVAEQFPFPGAAPATKDGTKPASAADQFPYPGSAPAAPTTNAPVPSTPVPAKGGAADQFPYPGETSKSPDAVPEGDTPRYVPDAPASGSKGVTSGSSSDGSSSSSSSSSAGDALPSSGSGDTADDAGSKPTPKGTRRSLPKVSPLSPDQRVTEDLNVARFYSGRGNYQAAYLRSKDATKALPDDAESHFALAEAAEKLQKKDEAVAEYELYLKLDPGGDKSAIAHHALTNLQ